MPRISVIETPTPIVPGGIAGHVAAVIDVLRATSSIVTAFSSGCGTVIPAASRDEALRLRDSYPGALLGGEMGGKKIEGFDLGNSPAEYAPEVVGNREVIMSTSNGTKAILGARRGGASPVLICSFLNLSAVARRVALEVAEYDKHVTAVCSGSLGRFSLEDFACAGALVKALSSSGVRLDPDESALEALETFDKYGDNILGIFDDSPHGQELKSLGFGRDLELCSKVDSTDVVPIVKDGVVVNPRKQ